MSNEGSLLRLFNCEQFTFPMLLEYLSSATSTGVLSFLINKISTYPSTVYEFYIPQLLNLNFYKSSCSDIQKVLLQTSIENHLFAMSLHGHLSALMGDCSQEIKEAAESFLESLEMAIVNGKLPKTTSDSAPDYFFGLTSSDSDVDGFKRKSVRSNYYSFQVNVIQLLCKISVGLNQVPGDFRNSKLKAWLKGVNKTIKSCREKYRFCLDSERKLFRGPVIGFKFYADPDSEPSQIVKIRLEKCVCFPTNSRVPYKLVFETVAVDEDGIPDNFSVASAADEAVDDLNQIDIEGISKTLDKNERFKGYSDFISQIENGNETSLIHKPAPIIDTSSHSEIWGESWESTQASIKSCSNFSSFPSWKLRAVIIKGLDDLRQEYLAMQLIVQIKKIWSKAHLSLYLRTYEIKVISHYMGIIEYIPNTLSIHSIKKSYKDFTSLHSFFIENWENTYEEAQRNFVQSMAGYSLVCYLLNIKDRHNANILIDNQGHIIHIDFGFFLTTSPGGNMGFESAPFKLSEELIEVMGGVDSEMFGYYKILLLQGFLELRKHANELLVTLKAMGRSGGLSCLQDFDAAVEGVKDRLQLGLTDEKCMVFVDQLVYESQNNWRTAKYDDFQYLSNGIL